MNTPSSAIDSHLRTIASYERYAGTYAESVAKIPGPEDQRALRLLVAVTGQTGRILELGSGPGWDADFVESLGPSVRRTDATHAFLDLMRARGKRADLLDMVGDPLGGPYDGILALCVLIHAARRTVPDILAKVFGALRPGGAFLVSVRYGAGETHGDYLMTYWSRNGFASRLAEAGFTLQWDQSHTACDGERWLTFLARRPL